MDSAVRGVVPPTTHQYTVVGIGVKWPAMNERDVLSSEHTDVDQDIGTDNMNINNCIVAYRTVRHGRKCRIPPNRNLSGKLTTIREASLPIHGAKLFNCLPKNVRNITAVSLSTFKRALDNFLATVPDEPQMPGHTASRRAETNSIIHMINVGNPFQDTTLGRMQQQSPQ